MLHLPENFRWMYKARIYNVTFLSYYITISVDIDHGFNMHDKYTFVLYNLDKLSIKNLSNELCNAIYCMLIDKDVILESIKENDVFRVKIWSKRKHPNSDHFYMEYINDSILQTINKDQHHGDEK